MLAGSTAQNPITVKSTAEKTVAWIAMVTVLQPLRRMTHTTNIKKNHNLLGCYGDSRFDLFLCP